MADEPKEKSLEMRVAELEDKLSKVHITEEEMKAYQKVSALLGTGGGISPQAGCILDCSGGCINECAIRACTIRACTIRACTIRACTIRACTMECINECGPAGGGMMGGGGFGGFGG
jgi:hypothetical protein